MGLLICFRAVTQTHNPSFEPTINDGEHILDRIYNISFLEADSRLSPSSSMQLPLHQLQEGKSIYWITEWNLIPHFFQVAKVIDTQACFFEEQSLSGRSHHWLRALVFCISCALPVWWFGSQLMWKSKKKGKGSCWIKLTMKNKLEVISRDHISWFNDNVSNMPAPPLLPGTSLRTPSGRFICPSHSDQARPLACVANEMSVYGTSALPRSAKGQCSSMCPFSFLSRHRCPNTCCPLSLHYRRKDTKPRDCQCEIFASH